MAIDTLTELKELKHIFKALDTFRQNPTAQFVNINEAGAIITVNKHHALEFLKSRFSVFGELSKSQLEDEDFLVRFISNKLNQNKLIDELDPEERAEIYKELAEIDSPHPEDASMEDQPHGEAAGEMTSSEHTGDMPPGPHPEQSHSGLPSMPSGGGTGHSSQPRIIVNMPRSGMEGGMGAGTAATNKFARSQSGMTEEGTGSGTSATAKIAKEPGMTHGTGTGTAAINKAQRLAKDSPPAATTPRTSTPPAIKTTPLSTPAPKVSSPASPGGRLNLSSIRPSSGVSRFANNFGSSVTRGLGRGVISPAARGLYNFGGGVFSRLSRMAGGGAGGPLKKKRRRWFLRILIFLAFFSIIGFIAGSSTTPTPQTNETSTASDIRECKFKRSDHGEPVTFKSPLLLSYVQEASTLTGIPPAVLAAFIRVESPATSNMTDEQVQNYRCIRGDGGNVSPTGALGIMQIQPEGTKGNDRGAIENGARLIGKNYADLTDDDYCNVRKSIIIGAGFILKKMTYKTDAYPKTYGDGTRWDLAWTTDRDAIDKMVSSYYGCLKYGSGDDVNLGCDDPRRIYSYGQDVWDSVQSCQATSTSPTTPVGGGKPNIRYYCEPDDAWQKICNIHTHGCGPTSMAIVVSSLGKIKTPVEMDQLFREVGARSCGEYGSTMDKFLLNSSWFNENFTYRYLTKNGDGSLNLNEAKEYLDNNYLIIGSSADFPCPQPGWCGNSSLQKGTVDHIFAVDNVDIAQNLVHVQDPMNCRPEHTTQYDSNQWISNRMISLVAGSREHNKPHPWLYAIAIKAKNVITPGGVQ